MEPNFYSFDVFDTLVTRTVATPDGIFALVQNKISKDDSFPNILRENFYTIRIEIEEYIRNCKYLSKKQYEISYDEIYETISENYKLSFESKEKLKNIEFLTERENLVTIKKNIEKLKDCFAKGRVVLISDMYFGASYIRDLLCDLDPIFHNIKIYSSADWGVSKSNSKLYEIVSSEENVSFVNWTHFGDSLHSDIKQAKRLGINAQLLTQEPLLPYEKYILKKDDPTLQMTIGNARALRVNTTDPLKSKFDFGASFAGPILYDYVKWLLMQSKRLGVKTLYFIARDGYIPKKIADIIIEQKQLNIKTKYIYGSRSVWRVVTERNYSQFIKHIFDEYREKMTLDFLSYRLSISKTEIYDILKVYPKSSKLSKRKLKKYSKIFIESEKAKSLILEKFKTRYNSLVLYLKQEIDFSDENIFFVDIYGTGRTQNYITDIINDISPRSILNFYYLTIIPTAESPKNAQCYIKRIKYIHHWVELITRCLDGQTIAYKKSEGKIVPELENIDKKHFLKWGFYSYLNGILSFTKNTCAYERCYNVELCSMQIYQKISRYLFDALDKETATILGTIPYNRVGTESANEIAAKPVSYLKILLCFFLCIRMDKKLDFLFISLARTLGDNFVLKTFLTKFPTIQKLILDVSFHRRDKKFIIRFLGIKVDLSRILK